MKVNYDYSLLPHNTFGMDVRAACFIEYDSETELRHLLLSEKCLPGKWLHIGRGSNLLFTKNYEGTVLHSGIKGYDLLSDGDDSVEIRVGAGEKWDDFVRYAVANEWYGAENLSLIPGEVGASAVQNIGAYGVEVKDLIVAVEAMDVTNGELRRFTNEKCRYAYRDSIFKNELKGQYIVTHVTYRLSKVPVYHLDYGNIRAELEREACALTLENIRRVIVRIRKEKLPDPKEKGNAGSFFMNPYLYKEQFKHLQNMCPDIPYYPVVDNKVKVPAAWLIERCGWKGRSVGHVSVCDKQALIIVNEGNATGDEVVRLADAIIASVHETFGITLVPEVNYI